VFSISPHRPTPNIAPSWNVAPTDPLPVVCYDETNDHALTLTSETPDHDGCQALAGAHKALDKRIGPSGGSTRERRGYNSLSTRRAKEKAVNETEDLMLMTSLYPYHRAADGRLGRAQLWRAA
jgi:hypothetical protein